MLALCVFLLSKMNGMCPCVLLFCCILYVMCVVAVDCFVFCCDCSVVADVLLSIVLSVLFVLCCLVDFVVLCGCVFLSVLCLRVAVFAFFMKH